MRLHAFVNGIIKDIGLSRKVQFANIQLIFPGGIRISSVHKKQLARTGKCIRELDRIFVKIHENNANSKLSDERFAMMSKTYEDEQTEPTPYVRIELMRPAYAEDPEESGGKRT